MRIELLYFEGCPNVMATLERLNSILETSGLNCSVMQTHVVDDEMAQSVRFLGSPTVRINGVDIEPSARSRIDFGIMCRTYDGSGVPPEDVIRLAIEEAEHAR